MFVYDPVMTSVGIVDDNPAVLAQMRLLLAGAGMHDVRTCASAHEALSTFRHAPPSILLIDYLMPNMDGLQLLEILQNAGVVKKTPVAMISGCADLASLRSRAFSAGAHEVLAKPVHPQAFTQMVQDLSRMSAAMKQSVTYGPPGFQSHFGTQRAARKATLLDGRPHERLVHHLFDKLTAFRDQCVSARATRLAQYSATIAHHHGLDRRQQDQLLAAVPLHDIGCIGVPDEVLFKRGPLNLAEQAQFERHPVIGFELLRDETTPLLKLAAEIALTHHEQWSGAGYPMGLEGVEIPLSGRIVAVADALEDQLAATPACGAAAFAAGVEVVAAGAGTRFDPAVIRSLRASVAALRRIHDHFNTSDPADTDWSTADPAA